MILAKKDIDRLIRMISLTKDDEINCEQFLSSVAEYVEQNLAGKSIPESLKALERHMSLCVECREEHEALLLVLRKIDGKNDENENQTQL